MKYPKFIVDMYKESCVYGANVTIDDVELECAAYESELGYSMDPSFVSDWYEDLYHDVESEKDRAADMKADNEWLASAGWGEM
jgi:hypothetical protein